MDASYRTRRRRAGGLRLPNLALIASLFLQPSQISSAAAAATVGRSSSSFSSSSLPPLYRRNQGEHVVLADCIDTSSVISSQMAYYAGDAGDTPNDVAVVVTPWGQAALWVNANTTALFTKSGVHFSALLGPRVNESEFAGVGNNGYGNFSCYQQYQYRLYQYGSTWCSQVYLCDHSSPPAGWTWGGTVSSGMSQGTIIGIAVGVVGGVLFLVAAGLVFWYLRRSRRAREGRRSESDLLRSATLSAGPASSTGDPKSPTQSQTQTHGDIHGGMPVMQQMSAIYEVDGRRFRVEMSNDNDRFEMDAHGHGSAELGTTKEVATPSTQTKEVSPVTPGLADSPLEHAHNYPRSPPPQYME